MKGNRKLLAVMLDWAGTTVDHGSVAPVIALQTLFARHGLTLSPEEARRDMGLLKRDHIQTILAQPEVKRRWAAATGREPGSADVTELFQEFGPLQMEIITQHSPLIAGVRETVAGWQSRGLRIGATTGYTRAMLAPVLAQAERDGYRPDASVCPDEAGGGRPAPWMLMRNAQLLDVYPLSCCVKIGDTISDIEEGRNAGMWTIGLTRTGNMVGLNAADWAALSPAEQSQRLKHAEEVLRSAGADFVVEDLPACEAALVKIDGALSDGSEYRKLSPG
jgi:phosphonoacetaldehyde hydrolase